MNEDDLENHSDWSMFLTDPMQKTDGKINLSNRREFNEGTVCKNVSELR